MPFLNHVQNREGFADGQRTAADVNDLLFELDRPSSPSLTVLIRSFRPVPLVRLHLMSEIPMSEIPGTIVQG